MADWKKSSRRILFAVVIAYFFLCACVYLLQRSLLYFPAKIPAEVVVGAGADHGFVPWKNSTGGIIGWEISAAAAQPAAF